ncbi:STAS domain-containing protein [Butyrivibrio sp. YAB3001]|uniref:STAS domain-containing protein n=1 Tax=Butyrivibrio sp. YAB3001 TaxID=1520812 RepID=UPI0008F63753|nr:STAS domain-containing protein [Butyrivibrio sp. YAB3001]SFC53506.1 anti-anti-sigma factor [Butyrivibrio sp. YAB3001]
MDVSSLNIDQELLERINPVFNTAKMTLFQLAATGDQDAINIADKLGLTLEGTQGEMDAEELLLNSIVLETRFRTIGAMAEKTDFATKVDMPCGYTPRAIDFSKKGINYVGLDLPAAITEGKDAITGLIEADKRKFVRFEGVDATNYDSLKKVFDEIKGEVCITTEGLLMYFTDSETGELCDNIRRILDSHGGCWLMADPETALQYVMTAQAIYGDRFMEIMLKGKKRAQDKSDVEVSSRTLVIDPSDPKQNMENAMAFLASHGLKAERLIVGDYVPELKSLKNATSSQIEMIKEAMQKFAYWKITPIEEIQIDTKEAKCENFDLRAEFKRDSLTLHLCGRLDTLSSPGLLALYEKTVGIFTIEEAVVDCSELEYISSAGLRVLLIMQKRCKRGVTLTDINDNIREILEQTGFDSILNIQDT